MRAVIQRVKNSNVKVDNKVVGSIEKGYTILLGVTHNDSIKDIKWLCNKIINLRIFSDKNEKMNLSLGDVQGEILLISQFTLYADCIKGRRPGFTEAASGEKAKDLYEKTIDEFKSLGIKVETGIFGADMAVELVNDGPVTIILDTAQANL